MRSFALAFVVVLLGAGLAGCRDSTDPPTNAPALRSAIVDANPFNTLSATVTVTAVNADSVFVRFWRPGEAARQTPAFPFNGDSVVRHPVLAQQAEIADEDCSLNALGIAEPRRDSRTGECDGVQGWPRRHHRCRCADRSSGH